ncbi:hypothetical protein [uncultured Microbacterium sp.]|uniref:FMN-binding protein n=1 Tax=uncultured Microbacterium sp. TaxID=191216 RepID=UPI0035CB7265
MLRTTAVPRPVRTGAAIAGVAGMLALAGCAATPTTTGGAATSAAAPPTTSAESSAAASGAASDAATEAPAASSSTYKDGSYTAEGSYVTPESVESITVTVTLADDVITAVEIVGEPQKADSKQYQSQFIGGVSEAVVGKDIDEISVSRVAGSSLTSGGFNQAIEQIKAEAAA